MAKLAILEKEKERFCLLTLASILEIEKLELFDAHTNVNLNVFKISKDKLLNLFRMIHSRYRKIFIRKRLAKRIL